MCTPLAPERYLIHGECYYVQTSEQHQKQLHVSLCSVWFWKQTAHHIIYLKCVNITAFSPSIPSHHQNGIHNYPRVTCVRKECDSKGGTGWFPWGTQDTWNRLWSVLTAYESLFACHISCRVRDGEGCQKRRGRKCCVGKQTLFS